MKFLRAVFLMAIPPLAVFGGCPGDTGRAPAPADASASASISASASVEPPPAPPAPAPPPINSASAPAAPSDCPERLERCVAASNNTLRTGIKMLDMPGCVSAILLRDELESRGEVLKELPSECPQALQRCTEMRSAVIQLMKRAIEDLKCDRGNPSL